MPRENITLQVGQCGLQLGTAFWDLALREHASYNPQALFDDPMSSFFRNVDSRTGYDLHPPTLNNLEHSNTNALLWQPQPIQSLRARAVLVDMEEGVINSLLKGSLNELFDRRQLMNDVSGAGNNFAHGHYFYGDQYADSVLELVRQQAELCDSLQSFFIMHSLGGGTGSGLGTRITALLHDYYPSIMRFTTCVFPSANDDVVTSPYNSVLALNQLIQHSDCVLPLDNQSLIDICERIEQPTMVQQSKYTAKLPQHGKKISLLDGVGSVGGSSDKSSKQSAKRKAFDNMNTIGSHLLTHLTSGMRFGGELNVDLNELAMTLVPYPSMHFLLPALAPLVTNSQTTYADTLKTIDAMCIDITKPDHQLMSSNPRDGLYLSCMLMGRGNVTVSDLQRNINTKLKPHMEFAYFNPDGYKVGVCSVAPAGYTHSVLALSNNTCVRNVFDRMASGCNMLYRVKAHLHHYLEYMEESQMTAAMLAVDDLIDAYDCIHLQNANPLPLTKTAPTI